MWVCFEGPVGCLLCGLRVDAVVGGKCRVRHCAGAVTLYTTGNGLQYHVLRMGYVWLRKDGSVNALLLVLVVVVVVVLLLLLLLSSSSLLWLVAGLSLQILGGAGLPFAGMPHQMSATYHPPPLRVQYRLSGPLHRVHRASLAPVILGARRVF